MSVEVVDRICANCSCKEGDHRAMFHPVTGLEADRRCDKCPCRWFAMAETAVRSCDCAPSFRCVSPNGGGEECGHGMNSHSSVAVAQRCLMTDCGCEHFTMFGFLHPSHHRDTCERFVPFHVLPPSASNSSCAAPSQEDAEAVNREVLTPPPDMVAESCRLRCKAHPEPLSQETIDASWASALRLIKAEGGNVDEMFIRAGKVIDLWRDGRITAFEAQLAEAVQEPQGAYEDAWVGLNVDALRALRRSCERSGNLTLPRAAVVDLLDRIVSLESANAQFAIVDSHRLEQIADDEIKLADACDEIAMLCGALAEDHALKMPYINDWRDERNKRHAAEAQLAESVTKLGATQLLLKEVGQHALDLEGRLLRSHSETNDARDISAGYEAQLEEERAENKKLKMRITLLGGDRPVGAK